MSDFALRPSAAGTWAYCHGSVRLAALYPEEETQESREGTAAHWAATEPLRGLVVRAGDAAPNGITITEEMIEGAALYQATVLQRIPAGGMLIEHSMPAPMIHPENGGTSDTCGFGTGGDERWTWHVIDYKWGHRFVEVFENEQLTDYAAAAVSHILASQPALTLEFLRTKLTFEFTIVQPRSFHRDGPVRSWRVTLAQLDGLFAMLRTAAAEAMGPDPKCVVGAYCRDCTARHACSMLQASAYDLAQSAGRATPFDLSGPQTGTELAWLQRAREILDARIDGLEVQALAMLQRGKSVPQYQIEHGAGREVWQEGKEGEVLALGSALGKDLKQKTKAITPAQAKAAGIPPALIEAYSHRPRGPAKLVKVDTTQTRKIFGGTKP